MQEKQNSLTVSINLSSLEKQKLYGRIYLYVKYLHRRKEKEEETDQKKTDSCWKHSVTDQKKTDSCWKHSVTVFFWSVSSSSYLSSV